MSVIRNLYKKFRNQIKHICFCTSPESKKRFLGLRKNGHNLGTNKQTKTILRVRQWSDTWEDIVNIVVPYSDVRLLIICVCCVVFPLVVSETPCFYSLLSKSGNQLCHCPRFHVHHTSFLHYVLPFTDVKIPRRTGHISIKVRGRNIQCYPQTLLCSCTQTPSF